MPTLSNWVKKESKKAVRDWLDLKIKFAQCSDSIESFANHHGIPISTARKQAQRDSWLAYREEFKAKAEQKASEAWAEQSKEVIADFNKQCFKLGFKLLKKADGMVDNIDKVSDLKALSGALKDLHSISLRTVGEKDETANSFENFLRSLKQ